MFWTLDKLYRKLSQEGFVADARLVRDAIIAVDNVLSFLPQMKDDGLKITDEEIASIRNEWSGNE